MAPGGLWQRTYQIHSDVLEGHLDDGQRNQRAGGRCLGRGPLTGRAGLTEPFHIGLQAWPVETVLDALGGVLAS